jgi:hypothetical protein
VVGYVRVCYPVDDCGRGHNHGDKGGVRPVVEVPNAAGMGSARALNDLGVARNAYCGCGGS